MRSSPDRFLLYVPPRAIVRMQVLDAEFETQGYGGLARPGGWPSTPLAVPYLNALPSDVESLRMVLDGVDQAASVSADRGGAARIVESRLALLDAAYHPLPVGRVARAHGWNPSVFSRTFKRAYGIAPGAYCKRVRIHDAMMLLLRGVSVASVAFEVGFGDLSHFYRQFRGVTGNVPGRYRSG